LKWFIRKGDYWEGSFLETGLLGGGRGDLMREFRRGLIKRGTHKGGGGSLREGLLGG